MSGSVSRERACLDELSGIKPSTYRLIPDHEGSRDLGLAKLGYQSEDLVSILPDVARPDRLRFGFRWDQSRSWLCFALDDDLLVDRGT